nr:MAG TPA: hypothetical protein [Caudoviricetes sp.]
MSTSLTIIATMEDARGISSPSAFLMVPAIWLVSQS